MTPEEYLTSHSLDKKFVTERLGWVLEENRIAIPVYGADRKLLYNKYRWLNPSPIQAKFTADEGSHPTLYCLHKIKNEKKVILCEGEPDAARLWQAGIPATTSTGGVQKFDDSLALLLKGKTVNLVLDNDPAGQKKVPQYTQMLESFSIPTKIVSLPAQYKDVCEYFVDNPTKEAFLALPTHSLQEWIIATYSSQFPILSNKEFLSQTYPAKKWLVKKLIRATGLTFLVGEGGVGKTAISYNLARAISEGRDWLDHFPTNKTKILLLDKENEAVDIQTNLYAQQATSPNILHYTTASDFSFMDETGNPTPAAIYLNAYVQENKVGVVILDSMVDFYLGNENDATDASQNILAWRCTFPDMAIIVVHHENKPPAGMKRSSIHRIRGSSHLFNAAQSVLSVSVLDEAEPEKLKVEHSKVRGARKQPPFGLEMIVQNDPKDPEETIITDFKHTGVIIIAKKKAEEAKEAVLELLAHNPDRWFTTEDIKLELGNAIENPKNIDQALPKIRDNRLAAYNISKKPYSYKHLTGGVEDFDEDPESFLDDLEEEKQGKII